MDATDLLFSFVAWSPRLTAWLLTYLVHSTALLGAVWIVTRLWVRSDAWRDLLWKTAVVGGIVTATLQQITPLAPLAGRLIVPAPARAESISPSDGTHRNPPVVAQPLERDAELAGAAVRSAAGAADRTAGRHESGGQPLAAAAPTLSVTSIAALGWIVGALFLAIGMAWGRLRLSLRLGSRRAVRHTRLNEMLTALRHATGIRRKVRITQTPALSSPIALGYAEICVPDAALTELDQEQQRGLLAHELGHLARFDPYWLLAAGLIERIFFFQPLNRLARMRTQEAAEYLCDAWAVRRTGSGLSLAKCLVKVAEWLDTSPSTTPVAGMAEDRSHLVARVRRLIDERTASLQPRRRVLLPVATGMLGLTVLAIPGFTAVRAAVTPPSAMETDAASALADMAEPDPAESSAAAASPSETGAGPARRDLDAFPQDRDTTVVAALIAALRDADVEVRRAVVRALANHKDSRARDALAEAVTDNDAEIRAAAIEGLAELGDRRTGASLIQALTDESAEVRRAAAHAVANLELPEAAEPLMTALRDSDAEVRQTAAEALAELGDRRAVPALIEALSDRSAEVRHEAAHALGHLQDPRAAAGLATAVADPSSEVRKAALESLGEITLESLPEAVLTALADADPEVRQAALETIGEHRDARAVARVGRLIDDPSPEVREAAIEVLAEIRTEAAMELIVAALKSADPNVRKSAAEALGKR